MKAIVDIEADPRDPTKCGKGCECIYMGGVGRGFSVTNRLPACLDATEKVERIINLLRRLQETANEQDYDLIEETLKEWETDDGD